MIQLYFLSILFNGLTGFILISDRDDRGESIETSLRLSLNNDTIRLVLGILAAITGLLKLLSPAVENIPFLGDLIPGLGGLAAGFVLIFSYYRERSTLDSGKLEKIGDIFLKYKKWLGYVLIVSAALHFLFPQALFI
jgi:hypothetical protein